MTDEEKVIERALEHIGEILSEREWGNPTDWNTSVRKVLKRLVDRTRKLDRKETRLCGKP